MPDKRQDSKQRRQARNRATRETLAARRENVAAAPAASASGSRSASSGASDRARSGAGTRAGARAGARGRQPAPRPVAGPPGTGFLGLTDRRPGDLAVLIALLLGFLPFIAVFLFPVAVDDRGEPIPQAGGGMYRVAREVVTGKTLPDATESIVSAQGPGIFLVLLAPLAVLVFAVWANRRPDRSRMLTFAMLGLAASVLLGFGQFFLLSLIALGVAGFQARKADTAQAAGQATGPARRPRGGVIDAESREAGDDLGDEEITGADLLEDDQDEDDQDEDEASVPDDADVLGEPEADTDTDTGPEGGGRGTGRSKRRR
ncbi:MAG TPA: hypothetical protein VFI47_07000 [Acidimicrobiales bacterium]|nr:hypothetical protein [Acidimicrobiales bacterium]